MTDVLNALRTPEAGARPRPLRVLHLGFEDPRMPGSGGGSVRTQEIDRRLAAEGLEVTVLTTRYPGCADGVYDGVRYEHVGIGRGTNRLTRLIGYVAVLPGAVRAHRDADLVVEDFLPPFSSMAVPLWTRRPVIGMVQWLHAREKARQYKLPFHLLEQAAVRTHYSMIAVSQGTADRLSALNPAASVTVIGNGVDPELVNQPAQLGRDVLCIGRLELEGKGMDLLLTAWARACRQVDADLVIAGRGPDEARVRRLAERLGIASRVRFVGWVSGAEKRRFLAASRLVVVPSRAETFGIVAVEALAAATPVLAFDIPCLREVVPAQCGRLVPPFDVEALAAAIVELYPETEHLLDLGAAGRAFAARYDWDVLARRQSAVYRSVAGSRRAGTLPKSVLAEHAYVKRVRRFLGGAA
jgi:glycogen synthase